MEVKSARMREGSNIPEQRVKASSDRSSKLTTGKKIEEPDSKASWPWTG
jgi:hypothetical protein